MKMPPQAADGLSAHAHPGHPDVPAQRPLEAAASAALLPNGFEDVLAPQAGLEARTVEKIAGVFEGFSYQRVKPPLVEFESTLAGEAAASTDLFRLADPLTNRMMALRNDVTVQVGRIAQTRLADDPRPLRLCYAGQVARVHGEELRPERQFTQVGFELIGIAGDAALAADIEAVRLPLMALKACGITDITVDLTLPSFVRSICADAGLSAGDVAKVRHALDRRDIVSLRQSGLPLLAELTALAGRADEMLEPLLALEGIAPAQRAELSHLNALASSLAGVLPDVTLTVDPCEQRGSGYHETIGFTLFAADIRGELGRGGRYRNGADLATGCTLYMDSLMQAVQPVAPAAIVLVAADCPDGELSSLQTQGHTIRFAAAADEITARNAGCQAVWQDGRLHEIKL